MSPDSVVTYRAKRLEGGIAHNLKKILRTELRRNHTLANGDHLLLTGRIFESKESCDKLLRIAQRYQALVSQYRIRYPETHSFVSPGAIGVLGSTSS